MRLLHKGLHSFGAGIFTGHQHATFAGKIFALNRAYAPKPVKKILGAGFEQVLAL
jgi:hypothetical protein